MSDLFQRGQVHVNRWVARDQLELLDYLDGLMTMNSFKDSWTLLLVGALTLC